jgi:hypothetical protein
MHGLDHANWASQINRRLSATSYSGNLNSPSVKLLRRHADERRSSFTLETLFARP